jgi:hypothetical protein
VVCIVQRNGWASIYVDGILGTFVNLVVLPISY